LTLAPRHSIAIREDVAMRTRDGVALVSDIYAPDDGDAHPTLLVRTPYGKSDRRHGHRPPEVDFFTAHGYTVVVQDTRGRGLSEGEYFPWFFEELDGYDAIQWAASLPESNRVVGTTGQSYCASAQYMAAPARAPHLHAMCAVSGPASFFEQRIYRRGVLEFGWTIAYAIGMLRATLVRSGRYKEERDRLDAWVEDPRLGAAPLTDEASRHVPIGDWGEWFLELGAPYLAELLKHDTYGPFWWPADVRRRLKAVNVPIFHVSSWYDAFQYDALHLFTDLRREGETEAVRSGQRLLMGPWAHLQPYTTPTSGGTGDIDFGDEARIELFEEQLRWFDRYLRIGESHQDGRPDGTASEPEAPVRLFVMGVNRWREEDEWPLRRAREWLVHIHSGGRANSAAGDGRLDPTPPSDQPEDTFVYDPHDPVPTAGGAIPGHGLGVCDQRDVEARSDVLVYTGDPVTSPVEITGYVRADFYAASSAPDTDFVARLVDVWPDGFAQNLLDGVVRARYRDSVSAPSLIQPGRVYFYSIDMGATSHVFLPGHRIRLDVTSSNFPRHDRNPNTGRSPLVESELVPATQRLFHDSRYPSRLVLPVING
jgi:uncharacterized protein